jgi:hypothetical protein
MHGPMYVAPGIGLPCTLISIMIVVFLAQKKTIFILNAENKGRSSALWLRNLNLSFFLSRKKKTVIMEIRVLQPSDLHASSHWESLHDSSYYLSLSDSTDLWKNSQLIYKSEPVLHSPFLGSISNQIIGWYIHTHMYACKNVHILKVPLCLNSLTLCAYCCPSQAWDGRDRRSDLWWCIL